MAMRYVQADQAGAAGLAAQLRVRLVGAPADGSAAAPPAAANKVIWVDAGDEVLVHLDSIKVRLLDRVIVVSLDLESDQTGRAPLIVTFSLGGVRDQAGLIATTDELPHGNPMLAARWGRIVQSALWAALMGIASDHAAERGQEPQAIYVKPGAIQFKAQVTKVVARPAKARR